MDALTHTAKEHSKNIIENSPKINSAIVKDVNISESVEQTDKSSKFKCAELFPSMINSMKT